MQLRYEDCDNIHGGVLSSRVAVWFVTDGGPPDYKVYSRVKMPHSRGVALQDSCSVDEAKKKAMKVERL